MRISTPFQIALTTFGILALELALIRWTSSQIRIFAYFNNLVLIATFLGMGLGVAIGRRRGSMVHWTVPMLLLVSIPLAFSEALHLVWMPFPDSSVFLWRLYEGTARQHAFNMFVFFVLFCMICLVFLFAGSHVGYLFPKIRALRAYSADLLGSLLGIIAFTAVTFFNATPPVWLCVGVLPFAFLSRKPVTWLAGACILGLGWYSVSGAIFSPYNRIDLEPYGNYGTNYKLSVNRDFHQFMHDLSDDFLASDLPDDSQASYNHLRTAYDLPFVINDHRTSALIVGAGTGNDVQGALRSGYQRVYSVDIDGQIIDLGRQLHPEEPYSNPRTIAVVNDARAFFEQYEGDPFDVVCYGLLDSHAMFSSMSSLRLDNFVYTEEGIRAAWRHVGEDGHLSISFSIYAGDWIAHRLYWTIANATGKEPIVAYHGMHFGASFIVARDDANLDLESLAPYFEDRVIPEEEFVRTTSDDWPFLYVRPGVFPWGYLIVMVAVVLLACITTPMAFGRKAMTTDFDPALFFMGAAFLLIETRSVTTLSLLFGSTWTVNAAVFSGILTMVLIANLMVDHMGLKRPGPWFIGLFLSVVLIWAFDNAALNHFSLLTRGILGGLINALPIGFAGIIVSILLSRSRNATASLGSNLLGSVMGGSLEYLSMLVGLQAIVVLAFMLYFVAFLFYRKAGSAASG